MKKRAVIETQLREAKEGLDHMVAVYCRSLDAVKEHGAEKGSPLRRSIKLVIDAMEAYKERVSVLENELRYA